MSKDVKVDVRHLKKYFGATKAVDDISFSFESGNVYAFIGPNGAGKTTTLRILATLDIPTDGDAFINGVSLVQYPEKARRMTGFVPDSLPDHRDITVWEYLDFFARASGVPKKERDDARDAVIEFTGVGKLLNKQLHELSKGMKQRVSLGRALVHDPSILLLDEPAAGLDPRARIEFRELITTLASMGKAIFISSHILTELTEVCNGVVIIEKGKILEKGSLDDVILRSKRTQTIAIRCVKDHEDVMATLLESPHVSDVRQVGKEIHVDFEGTEERCTEILTYLVQKNHTVTEFRHVKDDLEDIFMHITKGEVQ